MKRVMSVLGDTANTAPPAGTLLFNPCQPSEPLHLKQEFGSFFEGDSQQSSTSSACDFYSVHGLLAMSPRTRSTFYVRKDASGQPEGPSKVAAEQQEKVSAESRLYSLRYPQSLYGPMGETLPKLTPQNLNHPIATQASGISSSGTNSLNSTLNGARRSIATSLFAEGAGYEDRTLAQLADASLTAALSRDFGAEWNEALAANPNSSLNAMSCRFSRLKSIAEDFAAMVAPIACAIVESRNQLLSQRPYRPLPTLDHVYIVKGYVYVISETPSRVKLFGSHEAASKSASNEIRGARTILGNPFLDVRVPLSCCVLFMGYHVFVTAPIAVANNPEACLSYGSFKPPRVAISNGATYAAYKMAEYIPLMRHSVPEKYLPQTSTYQAETKKTLYTACDVKQVVSYGNGATYILDAARYMPPAACHTAEFSKLKTKEDGLGVKGLSRHPLEDDLHAYLTVLFRPEFMRHSCPIQLNADANAPHQNLNAQESISHAIHVMYTQNCWQLLLDLMTCEQSKTLRVSDLSSIFHRHGVNLRYMGKIYQDADACIKSNEMRENIKLKLATEACCRAFKSIVFARFAQEPKFRGEDTAVVNLFRSFLLCSENSVDQFWEGVIRPVMMKKFGFYVRVAKETTLAVHDSREDTSLFQDANGLNVYHCLSNVKRRVERVAPSLNWKDIGGGFVALDDEGIERLRRQSEDALSVLYPLLGKNAKENFALLIRAQQLISVDISSDLRGKKILVNFRPRVKACTPLIISQSLQAVVDNGMTDMLEVLGMTADPQSLCEAVEQACKAELTAIGKISESDPRATLPLQMLAMSYCSRFMYPQAYAVINRCFDLRRNIPIDIVVSESSLELAPLYLKAQSLDRAETLCVEGLLMMRNSSTGLDVSRFVSGLIMTARIASTSLLEASGKPQFERAQRVLDYLYYACFLSERYHLPALVHSMWLIATIRKKIALAMPCFRCSRPAELACRGEFDPAHFEKLTSDKDAMSVGSKPATTTTAAAASAAPSKGTRAQVPVHRRKKEEQRKDDDDIAEVFAKKTIERIQTLYLDDVVGGGPSRLLPAAPNGVGTGAALTAGASTVNLAALAHTISEPQQQAEAQEMPLCQVTADFPRPSAICKVSRYTCKNCSAKHPSTEKEPIMKEPAAVFARVSKLASLFKGQTALDINVLGDALLNLGNLELNPDAVSSAMFELGKTFGNNSRVVIAAAIQLADVLLENVKNTPASAGGTGSVVVVQPVASTNSSNVVGGASSLAVTQSQTTVGVANAEAVLHDALQKILSRPDAQTALNSELNTVVYKLQNITQLYSQHPVAKKEHAAAHYLSEVLPQALGEHHPLVGAAYNATKHYYVQLAKKRSDRAAASTALQTAGKYASLALRSRLGTADIDDELDSLLTVMADDIMKVLRAGSAADRKASEELYAHVKELIADSPYRTSPVIVQRLSVMEEIFKAQLKVMEQSEALYRLAQRIDDAKCRMVHLSKSIKRHHNRVDLYGHQCLQGITDIRDDIRKACRGVTEADVVHRLTSLEELHATLTKIPLGTGGSGSEDQSSDNAWDAAMNAFGRPPTALQDSNKHPEDDPSGSGAAPGSPADGQGKSTRVYVSPYAVLGGAPALLEDDMQDASPLSSNNRDPSNRAMSSSGRVKLRHSHRESMRPTLTSAAQQYLTSLTDSAGDRGPNGPATVKRPETVERLAVLMPHITQSLGSRNYNPIRSYAQQVQKKM